MTLVGTRPELIKMSRVIAELDRQVEHVLVHSGQNHDYELNQVFFDELEIRKPDYFLGVAAPTPIETISAILVKVDEVLEVVCPDALLIYGDTNTGLAVISAKRRKIPVFHMEAGNRCFDQDVPEELNRKIIDHLSDVNLVLTEHARRYLLSEGIRAETIIKTGSHMREVLDYYQQKIAQSDVLDRMGLEDGRYVLVSAHREENVDSHERLAALLNAMDVTAQKYGIPVLVSTHPRTRKRLDALGLTANNSLVQFLKPFGFADFIRLQQSAFCILSDSGTITEEAALLNLPAVTIRNAHERPEGMDAGTLVMTDLNSDSILEAISVVTRQHRRENRLRGVVDDYEVQAVSERIVRIVLSYTGYVNRNVWHRF